MATFTVKVTIAGSVQGRPINYEHTATLTGIEDVGQDFGIAGQGQAALKTDIFMQGASPKRGVSNYSGITFGIINGVTANAHGYVYDATKQLAFPVRNGIPFLYWHSFDYDAALYYDAGGTPGAPNADITGCNVFTQIGRMEYNALALYRAIT